MYIKSSLARARKLVAVLVLTAAAALAVAVATTGILPVAGASVASPAVGAQVGSRAAASTDQPRLGPWARSRGYVRVTQELGDALAEGSAPDATTRKWERCFERGNGAYVICPDGYIEVN